jgi:hypothetical protein
MAGRPVEVALLKVPLKYLSVLSVHIAGGWLFLYQRKCSDLKKRTVLTTVESSVFK